MIKSQKKKLSKVLQKDEFVAISNEFHRTKRSLSFYPRMKFNAKDKTKKMFIKPGKVISYKKNHK